MRTGFSHCLEEQLVDFGSVLLFGWDVVSLTHYMFPLPILILAQLIRKEISTTNSQWLQGCMKEF